MRCAFGEVLAETQGVGDAALAVLVRVVNIAQSKVGAVAEQTQKIAGGAAAGNDHDLADAGRA